MTPNFLIDVYPANNYRQQTLSRAWQRCQSLNMLQKKVHDEETADGSVIHGVMDHRCVTMRRAEVFPWGSSGFTSFITASSWDGSVQSWSDFQHITFCQLKVRNSASGQNLLQKKKKKNRINFLINGTNNGYNNLCLCIIQQST